ncbi:MAG: hypothetical protein KH138_04230 [Firmicutes bacterium]|nr:hypothetical protein [Bacillota bacterium]
MLVNNAPILTIGSSHFEVLPSLAKEFPIDYIQESLDKKKQEHQRALELQRKEKEDRELADLRKKFSDNPSLTYHPKSLSFYDSLPSTCPFDNEPLIFLTNISAKPEKGWCCLRCSRLFVQKKPPQVIPTKKSELRASVASKKNNIKKKKLKSTVHEEKSQNILQLPSSTPILPNSTILVAELSANTPKNSHSFIGNITITSSETEQNKIDGIYWMGRMLPSLIMISIQTNQSIFSYNNITYNIENYKLYSNSQKYLNIIARFYSHDFPKSIYVFAHKDIHRFGTDNYESVTAMVPCANVSFPVPITVYYEKSTQRYFINEEIYSRAYREYGLPYLKLHAASFDEGVSGKSFGSLRMQSELRLLGYNVSASDGLPLFARRNLLKEAMDSGILSKSEIMNHLEWLIHSRSKMSNMDNAIAEWKADLLFVSEYRASEQRAIWIKNFMSRFSDQQTHKIKNK